MNFNIRIADSSDKTKTFPSCSALLTDMVSRMRITVELEAEEYAALVSAQKQPYEITPLEAASLAHFGGQWPSKAEREAFELAYANKLERAVEEQATSCRDIGLNSNGCR